MFETIRAWVKRHRVWSAIIALVLLFILYRIVRPTPHDYEYVSETVTRGEVLRKVSASGKIRALNTIKVGTEVSGQVTKVYVDFNSPVKAGQVRSASRTCPRRFTANGCQCRPCAVGA